MDGSVNDVTLCCRWWIVLMSSLSGSSSFSSMSDNPIATPLLSSHCRCDHGSCCANTDVDTDNGAEADSEPLCSHNVLSAQDTLVALLVWSVSWSRSRVQLDTINGNIMCAQEGGARQHVTIVVRYNSSNCSTHNILTSTFHFRIKMTIKSCYLPNKPLSCCTISPLSSFLGHYMTPLFVVFIKF